jgi:hypothetical protein
MDRLNARQQPRVQISLLLSALLLLGTLLWLCDAEAQGRGGVLRIGMTAADIPYTAITPKWIDYSKQRKPRSTRRSGIDSWRRRMRSSSRMRHGCSSCTT